MGEQNRPIVDIAISKAQIDKLGDRLRDGSATDNDFLVLSIYRESFEAAYRTVVETIQRQVSLAVTGRPGKTTPSIIAKLQRLPTRLSQMQDIAGCRVVVDDSLSQERAFSWLIDAFPSATVDDRRKRPSHGYRAIHVIPNVEGKPVEIQLRTRLQHLWAELSESLAFRYYIGLKYGQPVPEPSKLWIEARVIRERILAAAEKGGFREAVETAMKRPDWMAEVYEGLDDDIKHGLEELRAFVESTRKELLETSRDIQTFEVGLPGGATSEARERVEIQIQALISRLEKMG